MMIDLESYCFGVDIDGTLTDGINPFATDHVFEEANEIIRWSKPKPGIEILKPEMNVVLITARLEKYRKNTIEWLAKNKVPYRKLVMIQSYKDDTFNQQEYLDYKLKSCLENNVSFMLDDDYTVIQMLNNYGIKSVQVNGNFETAFNKLFEN